MSNKRELYFLATHNTQINWPNEYFTLYHLVIITTYKMSYVVVGN
jgi:hypothetical protein